VMTITSGPTELTQAIYLLRRAHGLTPPITVGLLDQKDIRLLDEYFNKDFIAPHTKYSYLVHNGVVADRDGITMTGPRNPAPPHQRLIQQQPAGGVAQNSPSVSRSGSVNSNRLPSVGSGQYNSDSDLDASRPSTPTPSRRGSN